jgi:hypothetical protein
MIATTILDNLIFSLKKYGSRNVTKTGNVEKESNPIVTVDT